MGDADALRALVERDVVVEREGWAYERVCRVTARLQRDVAEAERLETLVIWAEDELAFTAPGRTIYFARRLLERLGDDDATAFVVAHELAHHRLGHVPRARQAWAAVPLVLTKMVLSRLIAGPEQERDADLLGLEICLDAGYDPERCVAALEHLGQIALDRGAVDSAFGVEGDGWLGSRRAGYFSLRERIASVRGHAAALRTGGARIEVAAAREAARRRRLRQAVLTAAGGAAVVAGLVVLRRRL